MQVWINPKDGRGRLRVTTSDPRLEFDPYNIFTFCLLDVIEFPEFANIKEPVLADLIIKPHGGI